MYQALLIFFGMSYHTNYLHDRQYRYPETCLFIAFFLLWNAGMGLIVALLKTHPWKVANQ
jgi:hypothetical protein